MARGMPGAFGGKKINSYPVWLGFCALFLLGLVDWRRPLSLRNLDLLVLLSFSVSLWFFNHGHVFAAMPLAYPGLVWLLARCIWIGRARPARRAARPSGRSGLLVGATIFLVGFRIGLNVTRLERDRRRLLGRDRRRPDRPRPEPLRPLPDRGRPARRAAPPTRTARSATASRRTAAARRPTRTATRTAPSPTRPTCPGTGLRLEREVGHAARRPRDVDPLGPPLRCSGSRSSGWRFGGHELAATLAFAWVAWPFTQYVSSSNTNDAIHAGAPRLGLLLRDLAGGARRLHGALGVDEVRPAARRAALVGLPGGARRRAAAAASSPASSSRRSRRSSSSASSPRRHAPAVFFHRTFGYQFGRDSPFSLWDWGQYHAKGLPDLRVAAARARRLRSSSARSRSPGWPRRRSPLQLAAFTGALLIGFEVVLTHWFYLYLPWFFPFVAFALIS